MSVNVEKISVKGNGKLLRYLQPGETFIHDGEVYMKIRQVLRHLEAYAGDEEADGNCYAICLTGKKMERLLSGDAIVEVVDILASVVEAGEKIDPDGTKRFVFSMDLTPCAAFWPIDAIGEYIKKQAISYMRQHGY